MNKVSRTLMILFCDCLFIAMFASKAGGAQVSAMERDLLLGLNVDGAAFGIESVIPGAAFFLWPLEEYLVSPGADAEIFLGAERFEAGAHGYVRFGQSRAGRAGVSLFAGAGAVHEYGTYFAHTVNEWVPEVQAGLRIAVPRWPVLYPVLSVRVKEGDTDSGALGLAGWGL